MDFRKRTEARRPMRIGLGLDAGIRWKPGSRKRQLFRRMDERSDERNDFVQWRIQAGEFLSGSNWLTGANMTGDIYRPWTYTAYDSISWCRLTLEALSQGLVFTIDETTFPVTGHSFRHTLSLSLQPPFDTGLRLREIYLEPESPFQAPAGHIPGPGGIKLGSPAPKSRPNHLIINTGRFQVNFTKAGIKTQRPATHLSATHLSATHHLQHNALSWLTSFVAPFWTQSTTCREGSAPRSDWLNKGLILSKQRVTL